MTFTTNSECFPNFINPLQPSGNYMYHQFNIQQFYVFENRAVYEIMWENIV